MNTDFETHPAGTAERIKRLEAALQPFIDFADPRGAMPADMVITKGSPMAKRQLTMGDCYAAAAATEPRQ